MADEGSNGASTNPDVDPDPVGPGDGDEGQWLPAADLARMMGIPTKAVTELGEAGHLRRTRENSHRPWMYRVPESRLRTPTGLESVVVTLKDALKVADFHARESFRMVHEPAQKLFEQQFKIVETLAARCAALEIAHTEGVKAREAALTEAHIRELATIDSARKGERWDQVFKTLGESVPPVLAQALETFLEWKAPNAGKALALVRELSQVLDGLELSPEQRERLNEILRTAENPAPQGKATTDGT